MTRQDKTRQDKNIFIGSQYRRSLTVQQGAHEHKFAHKSNSLSIKKKEKGRKKIAKHEKYMYKKMSYGAVLNKRGTKALRFCSRRTQNARITQGRLSIDKKRTQGMIIGRKDIRKKGHAHLFGRV